MIHEKTAAAQVELVGKIGSMALIRREDNDIDYNIFSRLGAELRPGMVWVSSGATEIGRLDYMKRNQGSALRGDEEEDKADYAAQGQAILMENYRRYIAPNYSVRQVLVEHTHFNDPDKSEHIRGLLLRCTQQGAIPIVNYNDPVSSDENRKMELSSLRQNRDDIVECVDNDETAAVVAALVKARRLLILTSADGIYLNPADPSTLVREVSGHEPEEVVRRIRQLQSNCDGASRKGAGGMRAKLEYSIGPVRNGTQVIIGHARHRIADLLEGRVPCTRIGVEG
jgi:glutamate 5-kinase